MILDDGRKWGRDKVSITLTRRQWTAILCTLLPYRADGWTSLFPNYFTKDECRRAGKNIQRQLTNPVLIALLKGEDHKESPDV